MRVELDKDANSVTFFKNGDLVEVVDGLSQASPFRLVVSMLYSGDTVEWVN